MGIKLERKKPRNIVVSLIHRLSKLPVARARTKLRLFLDLEWIFDRLCHEYSFEHFTSADHPVRIHSQRSVLDLLQPHQVVLDLGCATGDLSFLIAAGARHVTGVDHDARAIELARMRYRRDNLEFVHGDALAFLGTCGRRFDVLVLSHILEHLDNPRAFLLRFRDRFSRVYVEVPDFDKSYLNRYRLALGCRLVYTDNDHIWEFDRRELTDLLEGCGLEILSAEYIFGLQKVWCKVSETHP